VLRSKTQQQQQPQLPSVVQDCTPSLEAQATSQTPNVNSSSPNNMFRVVAMVFQQIMTQLNGVESEEDRIMAITKIVLKLMKQNGCQSSQAPQSSSIQCDS
jgi:hypothetical protein